MLAVLIKKLGALIEKLMTQIVSPTSIEVYGIVQSTVWNITIFSIFMYIAQQIHMSLIHMPNDFSPNHLKWLFFKSSFWFGSVDEGLVGETTLPMLSLIINTFIGLMFITFFFGSIVVMIQDIMDEVGTDPWVLAWLKSNYILIILCGILLVTSINYLPVKTEPIAWGGPKNIALLPILAQDQGFFAEEGLTTRRKDIQTGKIAMDTLIKGGIDIAILVETNIAFIESPSDSNLKVISIIGEKYDDAMLGRKNNITITAKDLEGKRIGYTPDTTSHTLGVNLSNISLKEYMPIDGELDAESLWQPFRYNVKAGLNDHVIELDDDTIYKAYAIIVVREDYAQNHEDEIEKYLKALIKAERYLDENEDDVKNIFSTNLNISIDVLEDHWSEYTFKVHLSDNLSKDITNERKLISSIVADYKGKPIPEYADVIAPEYLREIDKERVVGVR